jgi:phosphotransferase system enzyme I (PtsI)
VLSIVLGELRLTPLLLGLGLRSFSMAASAVPRVKQAVRSVDIDSCARFARHVMEQTDPARIEDLIGGFKATGVH